MGQVKKNPLTKINTNHFELVITMSVLNDPYHYFQCSDLTSLIT